MLSFNILTKKSNKKTDALKESSVFHNNYNIVA